MDGMEEQLCKGCDTVKPLHSDYFSINRQTPHGFSYRCKACNRKYQKDRIHRIRREQYEPEERQTAKARSFDEACLKEKFARGGEPISSMDRAI